MSALLNYHVPSVENQGLLAVAVVAPFVVSLSDQPFVQCLSKEEVPVY